MKKIIKITELDLKRIVKRVMNEETNVNPIDNCDCYYDVFNDVSLRGNVYFTQDSDNTWRIQIETRRSSNDPTNVSITTYDGVELPKLDELDLVWDEESEEYDLGEMSLIGKKAYDRYFGIISDAILCYDDNTKLIQAVILSTETAPKDSIVAIGQEVKEKEDGATIIHDKSCFRIGKKMIEYVSTRNEWSKNIKPCD